MSKDSRTTVARTIAAGGIFGTLPLDASRKGEPFPARLTVATPVSRLKIESRRAGRPSTIGSKTVRSITVAVLIAWGAASTYAQSGGGYVIKKSTIDGGGAKAAGGGYVLNGTVGQHDAGDPSGGGYKLTGGFWSPVVGTTPVDPSAPHDRPKNRYISFMPNNGSVTVAFRVQKLPIPAGSGFCGVSGAACTGAPGQGTCAAGQICIEPYPGGSPGGSCWVQAPVTTATADQYTAKCEPTPVFRVWNEPVIHVGDCEIIPVAEFQIAATTDGLVFTPPLAVGTIPLPALNSKKWGDVSGQFTGSWPPPDRFTNVNDLVAMQAYISNTAMQPHITVVNISDSSAGSPCVPPQVNVGDVQSMVFAIAAKTYGPPDFPLRPIDPSLCPPCP